MYKNTLNEGRNHGFSSAYSGPHCILPGFIVTRRNAANDMSPDHFSQNEQLHIDCDFKIRM